MTESVFAKYAPKVFPHNFHLELAVTTIAGGIPMNPKVAEGWIKSRLIGDNDALIADAVAQVIEETGATADEAMSKVAETRTLVGFKRDDDGLYIEGRQLKACIKEAASIAVNAGNIEGKKWGHTNKGLMSWIVEHVHVIEERIHLGRTNADEIITGFVHNFRGSSIKAEEVCHDVKLSATISTDWELTEAQWGVIWLTAERVGIGASRSQYGKFTVTGWAAA